ncbi:MAG: hypothetical protein WCL71_11270 [Deltaproteobacteria bacterium]
MSVKIFSAKGFNVAVTVVSIVIPAVSWLFERFWKKDYVPVMYDTGGNGEKRTLEKVS